MFFLGVDERKYSRKAEEKRFVEGVPSRCWWGFIQVNRGHLKVTEEKGRVSAFFHEVGEKREQRTDCLEAEIWSPWISPFLRAFPKLKTFQKRSAKWKTVLRIQRSF